MTHEDVFESVLSAAQAGAEWAFSRLYVEYNPRLERYFASRAAHAAEDLAADTWMGATRRLKAFEGDETQFRSWLFTIAHRRLLDHWTAQKKRAEESLDATDRPDEKEKRDLPSPENLEQTVLEAATARAAAARIARILNPDQAEVILLRLLGGLEVDQVAAILGKRPGTIRVLQHRALKKLAEEISLEDVTE